MPKLSSLLPNRYELLISLSIVAILCHFLYKFGPMIASTSKSSNDITNINTLAAGIKNVYIGRPNFAGLNIVELINEKAGPDKMVKTQANGLTVLQNGFGGLVEVGSTSIAINGVSTPDNAYKIVYNAVPSQDCERLSNRVANNFQQLIINGTIVKKYPSADNINPEDTHKSCSEEKNTIVFYGN